MSRISLLPFALLILSCALLLNSCGFIGGLDPAEKLATKIEIQARELQKADTRTLAFDYVPSGLKVKSSPFYDGKMTLAVIARKDGMSVISFNRWSRTTYHNRFVQVDHPMEQIKEPGEPFQIILEKSGETIRWIGIK